MKPKREKREWVKHSVHCRCDVALEQALAALGEIRIIADSPRHREVSQQGYGDIVELALSVLVKYGRKRTGQRCSCKESQTKGGQTPDAGAARNGPAASAEISEQQEAARMQALSRGGWEG